MARKNFYGSGSHWSGQLAAAAFSIFATLSMWKLNPRRNLEAETKKGLGEPAVPKGDDTS